MSMQLRGAFRELQVALSLTQHCCSPGWTQYLLHILCSDVFRKSLSSSGFFLWSKWLEGFNAEPPLPGSAHGSRVLDFNRALSLSLFCVNTQT